MRIAQLGTEADDIRGDILMRAPEINPRILYLAIAQSNQQLEIERIHGRRHAAEADLKRALEVLCDELAVDGNLSPFVERVKQRMFLLNTEDIRVLATRIDEQLVVSGTQPKLNRPRKTISPNRSARESKSAEIRRRVQEIDQELGYPNPMKLCMELDRRKVGLPPKSNWKNAGSWVKALGTHKKAVRPYISKSRKVVEQK